MNIETARKFLMWCSIVNYGILILWLAWFSLAYESMTKLTELFLRRKIEHLDTLNYAGIGLYKIGIILFNLVPWIVLSLCR